MDLARALNLRAGVGYRWYYGLLGGVTGSVGLAYQFPRQAVRRESLPPGFLPLVNDGRGLKIAAIKLDSIFPVFYKYYDDHPVGEAILSNYESVDAQDIKAFLNVKQFMDDPKECTVPLSVSPGKDGRVVLYGLFTDRILGVAEATKVSVSVTVEYRQYGRLVRDEYVQTLSVLDRNALTWNDDRKAAAFVSAKDPHALTFAKGVIVAVKEDSRPGVNRNLQAVLAMHQALLANGITYVQDPASALTTNNREVVDFIQFPQQTLQFRAGKCGDLVVLYCSLLESVGIATALITVPGHILMAADLEMTEADARQTFSNPDDFIYRDGRVWLPIETTIRTGSFMDAWAEGIHQWRTGVDQKNAAFYPVREAWSSYNPVVFSGLPGSLTMPEQGKIAASFRTTLSSFIENQIGPRVAELQRLIKQSGGNLQHVTRLGLLYAKFGIYDKAEQQFAAVLKKQDMPSTLLNMGNIYFLRGKYAEALVYYSRAQRKSPGNARVLLALAKANAALEKYEDAKMNFDKVKAADPELASQYAFLGSGSQEQTRAADVEKSKGEVLWQE